MGVISDVVGHRGDLRFNAGETPELQFLRAAIIEDGRRNAVTPIALKRRAGAVGERTIVLDQALERFPGQVQAVECWIAPLQHRHHAQRLGIVIEAAECRQAGIERAFSGMAEWRMPQVVGERERLGQILVEPQPPGQRARDLRNLERMGKPCPIVIALVKNENLGLVLEAPERGGMDDAVAIAPKGAAACAWRLGIKPTAACLRVAGIWRTGNSQIHWSAPHRPAIDLRFHRT